MTDNKPHIDSLTSARFFAALAVVLLHFSYYLNINPAVYLFLSNGGIGVCFFFVLSGFILTYTYKEWFAGGVRINDYFRFIQARFARIYPMHAVALLLMTPVTLLLVWLTVGHARSPYLTYDPLAIAGSWVVNLAMAQIYLPYAFVEQMWNAPSWSIGCEFFFYLWFPLIMAFLAKRQFGCRKLFGWSAAVLAISLCLSLAALLAIWCYPDLRLGNTLLDFTLYITARVPVFRISEFILGCLLGTYFLQNYRQKTDRLGDIISRENARNALLVTALLCIIALMVLQVFVSTAYGQDYYKQSLSGFLFMSLQTFFYVVPFSTVILCLAYGRNLLSALLEHPRLVLLGDASYSLYMIHWIFLYVFGLLMLSPVGPLTVVAALLVIGSTILASVAFYRYVETPARRMLRGKNVVVLKNAPNIPVQRSHQYRSPK